MNKEYISSYFREKMANYVCDICNRNYGYKRNLKRHIREKHRDIQYWNCVVLECVSKFIRRSYLSRHLRMKHGYEMMQAHEAACMAKRGDIEPDTDPEKVSDDDTILDVIADMDEAEQRQRYVDTAELFDNTLFDDHTSKTLEPVVGYFDDIEIEPNSVETTTNNLCTEYIAEKISTDVNSNNSSVDYYEPNSVVDSAYVNCNVGDRNNEPISESGLGYNDNDGTTTGEDEIEKNDTAYKGASVMINDYEMTHNSITYDNDVVEGEQEIEHSDYSDFEDISDIDVEVNAYSGDDEFDGVANNGDDYSDGSVNGDNDDGIIEDPDVIVISSDDEVDDETALEVSEMRTRIQTLVCTFTKRTNYIGNQVMQTSTSVEKDYYEHYE